MKTLKAGQVIVYIAQDEARMGKFSAETIATRLKEAASAGRDTGLWLMAAPSGFAFYRNFIDLCKQDKILQQVLKKTHFFQFDDYPVSRKDPRFPITFRHLLETYFFNPLEQIVGKLPGIRLMELEGTDKDAEIASGYTKEVVSFLEDSSTFVVELKGTGMDGHWGFHGAETSLDTPPQVLQVPMNSQNIHQQKIDWPQYFKTDADVPRHAYSFTVSAFLKADFIVDNVPQPTKEFAVLATYGTEDILAQIPSSALKQHPAAIAVLTEASAKALLEYRERLEAGHRSLAPSTLERLRSLWKEPDRPEIEQKNQKAMEKVLEALGML
ncbi:MAG: hypothetical protein SNJ78_00940 [Spirochaetales bacterium]